MTTGRGALGVGCGTRGRLARGGGRRAPPHHAARGDSELASGSFLKSAADSFPTAVDRGWRCRVLPLRLEGGRKASGEGGLPENAGVCAQCHEGSDGAG